jgi:hypothetical protein
MIDGDDEDYFPNNKDVEGTMIEQLTNRDISFTTTVGKLNINSLKAAKNIFTALKNGNNINFTNTRMSFITLMFLKGIIDANSSVTLTGTITALDNFEDITVKSVANKAIYNSVKTRFTLPTMAAGSDTNWKTGRSDSGRGGRGGKRGRANGRGRGG